MPSAPRCPLCLANPGRPVHYRGYSGVACSGCEPLWRSRQIERIHLALHGTRPILTRQPFRANAPPTPAIGRQGEPID